MSGSIRLPRAARAPAILVAFAFASSAAAADMLTTDPTRLGRTLAEALPIAAEQSMRLGSNVVTVYHQRVFDAETDGYTETENLVWWVRRGEAEALTTFVREFPPGVEVEAVAAFTAHAADSSSASAAVAGMRLLEDGRIKLQKGDRKQRATNLVVAFETAQPGDLIGVSIRRRHDSPLRWEDWLLAGDHPVARSELQVRNDWRLVFTVFGNRMRPGAMQKEVVEEKSGQILDLRIWVDDVDPIFREPFSPTPALQSPSISLVWRAERIPWGRGGHVWIEYRDWNMVAAQMAAVERAYLAKHRAVDVLARELATGAEPDELIKRLYMYVRDELQDVPNLIYEKRHDDSTIDDVLAARSGAVFEKCYLLLGLLRSLEIPAQMVWVHDPADGGFLADFPNWGQLATPLVLARWRDSDVWLDPGCSTCRPGKPRPRLAAAHAMTYDRDADTKNLEVLEQASLQSSVLQKNPVGRYLDMVQRADWCELATLDLGDGGGADLILEECTLTVDDDSHYRGTLSLTSTGMTSLREEYLATQNAVAVARRWVAQRFAGAAFDSVFEASMPDAEVMNLIVHFESGAVPEAMGDTWILPPALVYGVPSVAEWPATRRSAFHVANDAERHWQIRIPLPAGWAGAEVPADRNLGYTCLAYHVEYAIESGCLVVTRSLKERSGTVDDSQALDLLGGQAKLMRELELSPVVVVRVD